MKKCPKSKQYAIRCNITMVSSLIWCLALIDIVLCAKLSNCPKDSIHLEKILGIRPVDEIRPVLLYRNDYAMPVTTECAVKCMNNDDCRSFILHYNTSACYWYRDDFQDSPEEDFILDMEIAFFVKTCLEFSDKLCENLWIFERVPGAILIGNDTRVIPSLVTRSECEQHCLSETGFQCRSAKFRIKNNGYGPNGAVTGVCTLSNADRHTLPSSYRVSSYDDEYFENQCVREDRSMRVLDAEGQFCTYEEFVNVTLAHRDLLYEDSSNTNCKNSCETYKVFNCRGYSLTEDENGRLSCYLHSEDSKVFGPKLLEDNIHGNYYEKAQCLNITVSCTESEMLVRYMPETEFMGKIYMKGYSDEPDCFAIGRKRNPVALVLPLRPSHCGISKANGNDNRTLLSGTMILQYNALIQTQGDRLIRVGCIFGNESQVLLGTGVTISTSPSNHGSSLFNSTSKNAAPLVSMRIVDHQSQREVSDTQIGQELELIIEMNSLESQYDIWAGHLVAMTENNEESILLLDERGCPINLNVFPELKKVDTNTTKELSAVFQAFKFSSSPIVRFSVLVQFCPELCNPVDCSNGIESYGRKKREILSRSIETINGTKIIRVNRTQFESRSLNVREMPLEVIMLVRNPKIIPDRLIYGENNNKILVAGYDLSTNQVCFDYSLLVGMIITWVLIQIVFLVCCILLVRRYKRYYQHECTRQSMEELHKNFGIGFSNLENRRVHWADNNDFT